MILDSSLSFDLAAAITATRVSTNVIDLSNARDIGVGGRPLHLLCQVVVPLVGPAGTTLQVQWQSSADNSAWNTIMESIAYPAVSVPAGARFLAGMLPRQSPYPDAPASALPRYHRLNYIVGGGPLTAGALTATIVLERQDAVIYPKNFTVNA